MQQHILETLQANQSTRIFLPRKCVVLVALFRHGQGIDVVTKTTGGQFFFSLFNWLHQQPGLLMPSRADEEDQESVFHL